MILNKIIILAKYLNSFIYKMFLKKCGNNFFPGFCFEIKGGKNIIIGSSFSSESHVKLFAGKGILKMGNNIKVNNNVFIGASAGEIYIGNNVLIGPNTVIRSSNHSFNKIDLIRKQKHTKGVIIIEDDVWIGANVVILPNLTIKKGAVIGAGSIVTKSIAEFDIVAGNPAKKIGERS